MTETKMEPYYDSSSKLPHAFAEKEGYFRVQCARGYVNLEEISRSLHNARFISNGAMQTLVFHWKEYKPFSEILKRMNVICINHNPEFYNEMVREEAKRKVLKFFEKEKDTNLINGNLIRYQNDGVIFLQIYKKVILADQMGLGKTIQGIEFLLREKRDGKLCKCLIVVPASLKKQWSDEITNFAGDRLSKIIVDGSADTREGCWNANKEVYISNYESVMYDLDYGFLNNVKFTHLILDEASYLKNFNTRRYKSIKKISENIKSRIALTGTPLENRLEELWAITSIIDPSLFGDRETFKSNYKHLIKRSRGEIRWPEKSARDSELKDLRRKLNRIMIRRLKKDVLDQLPPISKMRVPVELERDSRVVHDQLNANLKDLVRRYANLVERSNSGDGGENLEKALMGLLHQINAKFVFMRELCLMPELLLKDPISNPKLDRLMEILDEISGEGKVVIFTEFRRVAIMLHSNIENSLIVHGGVDKKKRPGIVEEFKNSESKNVLITTSVFTYGVNLQFASYVINYDLHYNPAKMSQRTDRLHRIGQKNAVTVINIVVENSIEELIERMLARKHKMFCAVIEGKDVDPNFMDEKLVDLLISEMEMIA